MNFWESLGVAYVVGSSALGTILLMWSVWKHTRRLLDLAKRGEIEQMRDVQKVADQNWLDRQEAK